MVARPWVQRARPIGPNDSVVGGILSIIDLVLKHVDSASLSEEGEECRILIRHCCSNGSACRGGQNHRRSRGSSCHDGAHGGATGGHFRGPETICSRLLATHACNSVRDVVMAARRMIDGISPASTPAPLKPDKLASCSTSSCRSYQAKKRRQA